jgi:hypothetical protein
MFRVLSAPIIRSTIKTADAFIGTVHVSVWFKSVERRPRSGVYFTMSMAKFGHDIVCIAESADIYCDVLPEVFCIVHTNLSLYGVNVSLFLKLREKGRFHYFSKHSVTVYQRCFE